MTRRTAVPFDRQLLRVLLLLFLVIGVAHFLLSYSFGLYEDDYAHISPWMTSGLSVLMSTLVENFSSWPQGRPLHFSFPKIFGFIGFNIAGLQGIYIIGALILALNGSLFYLLLKRFGSDTFALMGALAFCLFPADTTRAFLTHAIGYQPALTFLLISMHLYLSGVRKMSYIIIIGALLTFEAGLAAFLVAPLLKSCWDRKLAKEFVLHTVVLALIALLAFIVRRAMGDHRVIEQGVIGFPLAIKTLTGMFIGPIVSMAQWLLGPARVLRSLDSVLIITIAVDFLIFFLVFSKTAIPSPIGLTAAFPVHGKWPSQGSANLRAAFAGTSRLGGAGLVWIATAYGFSFTHFPPLAQFGRMTSVHVAASFGASLLFAWLLSIALSIASVYGLRKLAIGVGAIYFALLTGYGLMIQREYRASWENQRSFWTKVVKLTPDVDDGTLIFAIKQGLPETKYILTHSWADPIILEQIYRFPRSWNQVPRLFVVEEEWIDRIVIEGDRMKWRMPKAQWPARWRDLPDGNVILLAMSGDELYRLSGTVDIRGHDLKLKTAKASPAWEHGVLFDLLIEKSNTRARLSVPSAGSTAETKDAEERANDNQSS